MSLSNVPLIISPKELSDFSKERKVSILDASWFMPNSPRNPREEFLSKRIPGAQFLDLDEVASSHELGLKHMMPQESIFAAACENFGIEPSSHVVIYDTPGIFSSPRALFMFRSFGHQRSSVLDGGLPAWISEGLPIENGPLSPVHQTHYAIPRLENQSLRSYEQMVANSQLDPTANSNADLILDARSRGRYLGTDPEPRPGLSSGHIPHSFSLPFNLFLHKVTGADGTEYAKFLPAQDIYNALVEAIGDERAELVKTGVIPVTASCGSGMTAGILWLGLKLLGVEKISLYDESWTGYAMRQTSKIEKST
ncbi:Thiosulfate/3-mercaptopyruvate sulfurtransferase 1, mitochondrial [Hypsizygus marmoreus]|uniref:Thiosulfate/3-mercaptopyruvate sulfurtransferase 1, mitochondrial n=1 Tax=Hypsizygus marmoreus TaxID=39966 RepID=A0A369K6Q5_HYPMA|nr:Thiosulfate/3-mercaptopyruvate sulfurtransferase 1, mitochondrial [Hypsizygus marmoreus]